MALATFFGVPESPPEAQPAAAPIISLIHLTQLVLSVAAGGVGVVPPPSPQP